MELINDSFLWQITCNVIQSLKIASINKSNLFILLSITQMNREPLLRMKLRNMCECPAKRRNNSWTKQHFGSFTSNFEAIYIFNQKIKHDSERNSYF